MNNITATKSWEDLNKEVLTAEMQMIAEKLENYIRTSEKKVNELSENKFESDSNSCKEFSDTALNFISSGFNLSEFEREILLLCAAVEYDSRFPLLCAKASSKPYCTFGLALSVLSKSHWSALNPYSPLRRWKLLELESGQQLTSAQLRIDEKILHYLAGISYLDERLEGIMSKVSGVSDFNASNEKLVQTIIETWKNNRIALIQFTGNEDTLNKTLAFRSSQFLNVNLFSINSADIPTNHSERLNLARLWEREAVLNNAFLFIDHTQIEERSLTKSLGYFLNETKAFIFISGSTRVKIPGREVVYIDVKPLSFNEKFSFWEEKLNGISGRLGDQLEKAAFHFQFNSEDFNSIISNLKNETELNNGDLQNRFWNLCRIQSRHNLGNLVQRIGTEFTWKDIVLPEFEMQTLKEITIHLKESHKVYEAWGFKRKGLAGSGISALFTGVSGTGKTLAAGILANELQLDLYRVDLSSVVSKYIGETEKNLKHVFDSAEKSGAILLFDEADALFGKRSDVKDSHDRYANIEVSYLLQKMESYKGLSVLTTNFKNLLDNAFLRRIRFIIHFPFPDINQRLKIWQNIFPTEVPFNNIDFQKLSRLNIPGGNIRNIALNAAFLAASEDKPVSMLHMLHAAKREYSKLEKSLTNSETEGWI